MWRIGLVEYINAYPFALALNEYNPIFAPPSHINALYKKGELDLFVGSSTESTDAPYLPDVCIAAHGKINSVNLYTKVPPQHIQTVQLDPNSGTSNALLKILLKEHWNTHPNYVTSNPDAFLLIGDKALLTPTIPGYLTYDLATAWYELTALPFVFALLMHRPNLECSDLSEKIHTTLQTNFVQEASKRFRLKHDFLADYLNLCHYRLGQKEKQGLELFLHLNNLNIGAETQVTSV